MELTLFLGLVAGAIIVFFFGAVYGWGLRERHATRTLHKVAEAIKEKIEEEVKNVVQITIEKHNDMLFVYDKENHTFMAQGKDREELEKNLKARYPDKKFACEHETLVAMGFIS